MNKVTITVSETVFNTIKKKMMNAGMTHVRGSDVRMNMHNVLIAKQPKKKAIKGELITGKELRAAALKKLPVYYIEEYYSPSDKHMSFKGKCVMKKISPDEFYIGNSDIDVSLWQDDELVRSDFNDGEYAVYKVNGIKYL